MLPSVVPRLATDSAVRVFTGVWKLLSFLRLPSQDGSPSLPLLCLFLSFIVCPTSFPRQWAASLGAWCSLPAFRSGFVEFAQGSNVLSMNLWRRKWSPHPIPLPSLLSTSWTVRVTSFETFYLFSLWWECSIIGKNSIQTKLNHITFDYSSYLPSWLYSITHLQFHKMIRVKMEEKGVPWAGVCVCPLILSVVSDSLWPHGL